MRFLDNALRHLTKPAKTNSRRHYRTARAVAEVLEQRVLLSTFVVTNLLDDGSPGTFRWAVAQADANTSAPNTITFQGGLTGIIHIATPGSYDLTAGTTTIIGPGAANLTLQGDVSEVQVFQVGGGAIASISGLTIQDGQTNQSPGPGINNAGSLTLTDCYLTNNAYANTASPDQGFGGAIYNSGNITINNCTVYFNQSTYIHVGFAFGGGGIANAGTMTLTDSTISANFSGDGAGIYNSGTATITNCTVSNNGANVDAGGIYNQGGTLTISDSTISVNTGSGGITNNGGDITLNNSIVAQNTGGDISGSLDPSSSFNLIGDGSGGLVNGVGGASGNILGTVSSPINADLAVLTTNGGLNQTLALMAGSPAIDTGSNSLIPAGITTDQRGFPRINNGTVDMGAFESLSSSANTEYVTQLYTDILHRSPDAGGLAYWTGLLNSSTDTYQQVALGFTLSVEYYNDTVTSMYQQYLGRAPSAGELSTWVNQILAGANTETVRAGILGSSEYYNDSGGTADGYITALYQTLLGRTPDSAGQTYWEGILAGPGGTQAVAKGVVYSLEFHNDLINSYYEAYIGRAATSDEMVYGATELVAGVAPSVIIVNIVSSADYFTFNSIS